MQTETNVSLKTPWFPWIGKKRPFYGWVIVAVSYVTAFAGNTHQGYGTYFSFLQKEFGWNRAMLAAPRSVMQLESGTLGPLEGFLMDKLGPRILVIMGTLIMGLGFILFGLTHSLWMYFVSNIIVALGGGLQGPLVTSVAINHWFRRKRATANAINMLGGPMFGIVGVPALIFIQGAAWGGWRASAVITGLFIWAVGLPISMLMRRSPEPYGLLPDGDKPAGVSPTGAKIARSVDEFDFTLRQALRTRTFWFLVIAQATASLGMQAVFTHVFFHLEAGVGLTAPMRALVWSVVGFVSFPARLVGGLLGDRLPKYVVVGVTSAVMAASTFILGIAASAPMALAFAFVFGIGWGARNPVFNAIQGDYFGRRSQGVIRGWLNFTAVPFSVGGPMLAGYMADISGSYRLAFVIMAVAILAGSIIMFFTPPPQPPVRKEDTLGGRETSGRGAF